ncbi:MAG: hypothetical protein PHF37_06470, partial [Phycisphaerae bacterium]|nr:hypothetical protein [Phycisphaerae bacterium]
MTQENIKNERRQKVEEIKEQLGEGWQVKNGEFEHIQKLAHDTAANYRQVVADLAAALNRAESARPIIDRREEPEAVAERQERAAEARAKREEMERKIAESHAAILAKTPPGAKALIVARLVEDRSDLQSDYHTSEYVRNVAI